jgi:exodeoxyribonuclease V alpha subunit
MEVQTGIVSRVVWRSEDSDRKILLVRYESSTGLVDGRMAVDARDVSEGDWFSAHGQWRVENYRGQQAHIFQAKSFRPELPSSEEGARAFLGKIFDGSRHGVDFTRIAGFVRKHGPQCCRKAEQDAEILLELSSDPTRFRNRMAPASAAAPSAGSLMRSVTRPGKFSARILTGFPACRPLVSTMPTRSALS